MTTPLRRCLCGTPPVVKVIRDTDSNRWSIECPFCGKHTRSSRSLVETAEVWNSEARQ